MLEPIKDVDMRDESEEEYDENADEDFNPDKAIADHDSSSSSDDETTVGVVASKKQSKRKANRANEELDSGDEATVQQRDGKRPRRTEQLGDVDHSDDDWKIKTRSQRLAEKIEAKQRRRGGAGKVTIDVNKVWADLSSLPVGKLVIAPPQHEAAYMENGGDDNESNSRDETSDDFVTIKRRINFAGTIEEIEKRVLRSSREAQEYFTDHPEADPNHRMHDVDSKGLRRPMKRPSIFEPNPMGNVKGVTWDKLRPRAPSRLDVQMAEQKAEEKRAAIKMSTVQKSALDWKGFVNKEGFQDELDTYGKSNRGFLDREAFLGRAAATRERAVRDARMRL